MENQAMSILKAGKCYEFPVEWHEDRCTWKAKIGEHLEFIVSAETHKDYKDQVEREIRVRATAFLAGDDRGDVMTPSGKLVPLRDIRHELSAML